MDMIDTIAPLSDDTDVRSHSLSDGRSRRARLAAAGVGVIVLMLIWIACALLRDDATRQLAARAAAASAPTGLAAAGDHSAAASAPSHFIEFLMISTGVIAIGILIAFVGKDVLGERLTLTRAHLAERDADYVTLSGEHGAALAELRQLVEQQLAVRDSVPRLAAAAHLHAASKIELRAAEQHDLHGYWSQPGGDDDEDQADADRARAGTDDGAATKPPELLKLTASFDEIMKRARALVGPDEGEPEGHNGTEKL